MNNQPPETKKNKDCKKVYVAPQIHDLDDISCTEGKTNPTTGEILPSLGS